MRIRRQILIIGLCLVAAGCTRPNHIGNPVLLPVRGVLAGLENAGYAAKRARVKTYIETHEEALRAEDFSGPATEPLFKNIPQNQHYLLIQDLREAAAHPDFAERATVSVMVHQR